MALVERTTDPIGLSILPFGYNKSTFRCALSEHRRRILDV